MEREEGPRKRAAKFSYQWVKRLIFSSAFFSPPVDPSGGAKPDVAGEKACVRVEESFCRGRLGGHTTLIVVFSGLGTNSDCSVLLVRDTANSWFHNVPGVEGGVVGLVRRLAVYVRGYSRIVCMGYSMGGYAALLLGKLLRADVILSFAPQTVLTVDGMAQLSDARWSDYLHAVRALEAPVEHMDLKCLFSTAGRFAKPVRTSIYYPSAGDELDLLHAKHLAGCADLTALDGCVAHSGFAIWLRRSGALRMLVDEAVSGRSQDLGGAGDRYGKWLEAIAYEMSIDPPSKWSREHGRIRVTGIVRKSSSGALDIDLSSGRPVRVGARRLTLAGHAPWPIEWRDDFAVQELVPGVEYPFHLSFEDAQLPAGPNQISISLVKEHEFWFRDLGLPEVVIDL